MKKSIKFLSLFLSFVIVFVGTASAYTPVINDNKLQIKVLEESKTENEHIEVSMINNVYYYFHDTDKLTLTAAIYPDGRFEAAMYDKTNDSLQETVNNDILSNKLFRGNLDALDISGKFKFIENQILNNNIALKPYNGNVQITESERIALENAATYMSAASTTDTEKINAALTNAFGSPYTGTWCGMLSTSGYTGNLYETMYFQSYVFLLDYFFAALTTVSVIAAWASMPATTIALIFTVADTGMGVLAIVNAVSAKKYTTNVHWTKRVKVETVYPYYSSKTQNGISVVGDVGAAYNYGSVNQHYDFDDNIQIIRTGIQQYIDYYI